MWTKESQKLASNNGNPSFHLDSAKQIFPRVKENVCNGNDNRCDRVSPRLLLATALSDASFSSTAYPSALYPPGSGPNNPTIDLHRHAFRRKSTAWSAVGKSINLTFLEAPCEPIDDHHQIHCTDKGLQRGQKHSLPFIFINARSNKESMLKSLVSRASERTNLCRNILHIQPPQS